MEPLAIQSGVSQTVRPVLALDANLTAVLSEGRTVAGEVLQTLDGKSVLIGLGRNRVPAESNVELAPGDRFLARVETTAEGTVLKLLGGRPGAESQLLVALRGVVGDDLPVGELLEQLGGSLRRAIESGEDGSGKLARLVKSLGEHVYAPGSSGEELRELLARAGLDHEAVMVRLAENARALKGAAPLLEFSEALLGILRTALAAAGIVLDRESLARLRAALEGAPGELALLLEGAGGSASLTKALSARLRAALAALPEGPEREALLAALPRALAQLLGGDPPSALARALLEASSAATDLRALEGNLKSQLLAALAELGEGPERQAVQRALAGLEAEQLFNVARKEFAEGWHLSLPIPDGERLATAHLFYRDAPEHEEGQEPDARGLQRMTLTVDFSALGPLRAELGVREDLVALRLLVTRPEIAAALDTRLDELRERLASGGREVRVALVLGTREEAAVDSLHQNIRWLQEHHLMDLSG